MKCATSRPCSRRAPGSKPMVQTHPDSGATYRTIARKDGAFEIEVSIPDTVSPITMTNFPKQADAERWIEQHKASVNAGPSLRQSFKMPEKRSR